MELSDIVTATLAASTIMAIGSNVKAYFDTRSWLSNHSNSIWWNERKYGNANEMSLNSLLRHYVSYPGRQLAYKIYFLDNAPNKEDKSDKANKIDKRKL